MEKKWFIPAGILLCCGALWFAGGWKESLRALMAFHEQALVFADQTIDEAVESVKAMAKPDGVHPQAVSDQTAEDVYSRFASILLAAGDYRAAGTGRQRTGGNDRTFGFDLTVSGAERAFQETAGEERMRTVWSEGVLYRIDETAGTIARTNGGKLPDILKEACLGKVIAVEAGRFGEHLVTDYEIYYGEAIYRMSFDGEEQLRRLQKLTGGSLQEFVYDEICWGSRDDELLRVDTEAYQTVKETYLLTAGKDREEALSLPPEYPSGELPLPEGALLTSVRVNFDETRHGAIMLTYLSERTAAEEMRHYTGCLAGTKGYLTGEELRSGKKVMIVTGTAGRWSAELIEIKDNKTAGRVQVNMLLTNQG